MGDVGSAARRLRPAGLGTHRRRRPDHPHRRDQPAQRVPGRRRRHRRQTCCSPCVRRGRRPTRESDSDDVAAGRRRAGRRRAARRARQLRGHPVADPARPRRRHRVRRRRPRRGDCPTSTAPFSRRRCGTRSGWSSRRWARPVPGHHRLGAAGRRGRRRGCRRRRRTAWPTAVTAAADAAVVALDKTTGQLDVLADAGVVDAGGRGLLVLLDALRTTLTGQAPAPARCTCRRRRTGRGRRDHRRRRRSSR